MEKPVSSYNYDGLRSNEGRTSVFPLGQTAAAFPAVRYIKVDADKMSVRALLQWDLSFLPSYTLVVPSGPGKPRQLHRWPTDGLLNPYDGQAVLPLSDGPPGVI
jgi:hypothetical protein